MYSESTDCNVIVMCAQNVIDNMYKSGNKPRAWEMLLELVPCHVDNLFSACTYHYGETVDYMPTLDRRRYDNTKFQKFVGSTCDNKILFHPLSNYTWCSSCILLKRCFQRFIQLWILTVSFNVSSSFVRLLIFSW
jgi:hypothetical protein